MPRTLAMESLDANKGIWTKETPPNPIAASLARDSWEEEALEDFLDLDGVPRSTAIKEVA
jgi:hypothetical protein